METKACERCGLINPGDYRTCDCGHLLGTPVRWPKLAWWRLVLKFSIYTAGASLCISAATYLAMIPLRVIIFPSGYILDALGGVGTVDTEKYRQYLQTMSSLYLIVAISSVAAAQILFYLFHGVPARQRQRKNAS